MGFDLKRLIAARNGEQTSLGEAYINPQFVKVLKTLGFDTKFDRGEGAYLFDGKGEKYLDFICGYGVHNVGRNHPLVIQALKDALELNLANLVQMDAPLLAGLLAEKLVELAPDGLQKVFFTNSGTEAVEGALKLARGATGREKFIYTHHGFHGLTLGALSVNGCREFRDSYGDLLLGEEIPFNDVAALEQALKGRDVAAFILEPIQGKGLAVANDDYLRSAQEICHCYGSLLIVDEVQTGLGRTGKMFASEHWQVTPDLMTLAKGLSGGLVPVGAILMREEIYEKNFTNMEKCMVHSSTFGQNSLAMACGLATLEVLVEEELALAAAHWGEVLQARLEKLGSEYEMFEGVRGKGLMLGVQFKQPKSMKLKVAWKAIHAAHQGMFGQLLAMPLMAKHRILTQVSGHNMDSLKIMPALIIGEAEVDQFCVAFEQVLADCHQFPGGVWETGMAMAKRALRSG